MKLVTAEVPSLHALDHTWDGSCSCAAGIVDDSLVIVNCWRAGFQSSGHGIEIEKDRDRGGHAIALWVAAMIVSGWPRAEIWAKYADGEIEMISE